MAFARIGIFEVAIDQMSAVVDLFRDRVTPTFASYDGFLGYSAFVDVSSGRYIGLSYWSTLANLEASDSAAKDARESAADLGARVIGEPIVAREEFVIRKNSTQA